MELAPRAPNRRASLAHSPPKYKVGRSYQLRSLDVEFYRMRAQRLVRLSRRTAARRRPLQRDGNESLSGWLALRLKARFPAPCEELLLRHAMLPSDNRHDHAGFQRRLDRPRLLALRPTPPPARTRNNFNPANPSRLRLKRKVESRHKPISNETGRLPHSRAAVKVGEKHRLLRADSKATTRRVPQSSRSIVGSPTC